MDEVQKYVSARFHDNCVAEIVTALLEEYIKFQILSKQLNACFPFLHVQYFLTDGGLLNSCLHSDTMNATVVQNKCKKTLTSVCRLCIKNFKQR